MSDSRLQFRVGLFVIVAGIVGAGLALRFGELSWLWERNYSLALHFEQAPGVMRGVPVRKNGVTIGKVREVFFDETRGGVTVLVEIASKFSLRSDSRPQLSQSLLGDAAIEFTPGKSTELLKPGSTIDGSSPLDPLKTLVTLGSDVEKTLAAFRETSTEWQKVGRNVNQIVETNRGDLNLLVEQAADSMHEFSLAMKSINGYLKDPEVEANLKKSLAALPKLVEDTQGTVEAIRSAVRTMDGTFANLNDATAPLAKKSASIIARLDSSSASLELLLAEMNTFSRTLNKEDGSLQLLVSDPQLYRNLNQSASTLNTLLKNLDPIMRDVGELSRKLSSHPELLGLGGVLPGRSTVRPAEYQQPARRPSPGPRGSE